MQFSLELIAHAFTLVFGVLVSCYFADLPPTRMSRISVVLFILSVGLVQCVSYILFGIDYTAKLYPFITHLPLVIFLVVSHKRTWLMALSCVFSAYLCCQTSRWMSTMTLAFTDNITLAHCVKIITVIPLLYIMHRFVAKPAHRLMSTSTRTLLLFIALPFAYYIFDYVAGVYSDMLYSGIQVAVEFIPSIMSIAYFAFVILYSKEEQRRMESENEQIMLAMQTHQAIRSIEALRESQHQAAIYRHDLHHHLMYIVALADEKNVGKIKEYIQSTQHMIESIVPVRYCENEMINLLLSSFQGRAQQEHVSLSVDVHYAAKLHLEDISLCTLFSNALENAINATAKYEGNLAKTIRITGKMHREKLILMVENPYSGQIHMENGVPLNTAPGHGMGVKSIISVTERYDGLWVFLTDNGLFTLKVIV